MILIILSLIEWMTLNEFSATHSLDYVFNYLFKKYELNSYQMPGAKPYTKNVTISTVPTVMKRPFSWEQSQ